MSRFRKGTRLNASTEVPPAATIRTAVREFLGSYDRRALCVSMA